jgi:4-amino-4-deoxy-L-arabinose transferase-like glycosyltransferase
MKWFTWLNEHKWLFIFLILAVCIRAQGLDLALYSDEAGWANDLIKSNLDNIEYVPHPPLMIVLQQTMNKITNADIISFRLVPFLISIMNTIIIYIIARRWYNKKTAIIAVALFTVSYWATQASLQIDMDGSLIMTWFLLAAIFTSNYFKKEKVEEKQEGNREIEEKANKLTNNNSNTKLKNQTLLGIVLGLIMLSKYTGILLFAMVFVYAIIKTKNIKKTIQFLLVPTIVSGIVFSLFPLWTYLTGNTLFSNTLGHTGGDWYLTLVRPLTYLFLWATPLLFYFTLLHFCEKRKEKNEEEKGGKEESAQRLKKEYEKDNDILLTVWIGVIFLFYTFIISGKAPTFGRYFMPMIPPLILLSARYIAKQEFTRKQTIKGIIAFIATYLLFKIINLKTTTILNHNINNYINSALQFKLQFLFPYTGSSGPFFWISFTNIALTLTVTTILLSIIMYKTCSKKEEKKKNISSYIMMLLVISAAFNMLLITEYIYSPTQPSHTEITNDIVKFLFRNGLENRRTYTSVFQQGIFFHTVKKFPDKQIQYIVDSDGEYNTEYYQKELIDKEGVAVIIDMPMALDKEGEMWDELNKQCKRTDFEDKGKIAGFVFDCEKPKQFKIGEVQLG